MCLVCRSCRRSAARRQGGQERSVQVRVQVHAQTLLPLLSHPSITSGRFYVGCFVCMQVWMRQRGSKVFYIAVVGGR